MHADRTNSDPLGTIRIYRQQPGSAGGRERLLLDDNREPDECARLGFWDLTRFLERRGKPTNLTDLFEVGWLDREHLQRELPGAEESEGWERAVVPCDDGIPTGVGLPLLPSEVGKILCLGKNFRAHAEEFGEEVPSEPLFFNKLPETLLPHAGRVRIPDWYPGRFDHEAELAVVIGWAGRDILPEDALDHVAGYTVANDLTARTLQGADRKIGHPWLRAKNMEGSCPLGPAFVPRDCLDVNNLTVTCHVNGELRQSASTADWVVGLPEAIAYLSRHLQLNVGDLILMGTPSGVSALNHGDHVVCSVSGIGSLQTEIERYLSPNGTR